ncbi:MAG: MarR family winged helix-turn-helix transcriptional regulator [Eubacteriales bacterium]
MKPELRRIVRRINQLNILHRIFIHRAAVENGLFLGQLPILEYIIDHDRCTQTELAETLQVSAPSIATSIKRMQKAGLLLKTANETDHRYNRISITEKGLHIAGDCRVAFDAVDASMFTGFSPAECETLNGYLERLNANLETSEFKNKTFFAMIDVIKKETAPDRGQENNKGEIHV